MYNSNICNVLKFNLNENPFYVPTEEDLEKFIEETESSTLCVKNEAFSELLGRATDFAR
jgi:histidinol-phosphate/aromatic aminotransferase/cobyric acid decarboxylase-like protein